MEKDQFPLVTIRKDWEMIPKKLTGYDGFAPNERGRIALAIQLTIVSLREE